MDTKRGFLIVALAGIVVSCIAESSDGKNMRDIGIFLDGPASSLARAVQQEDRQEIRKILDAQKQLLNYRDDRFGVTLVLWAVGNEKYAAVSELLLLGADPNIAASLNGETPLFVAAGYSWVDRDADKSSDMLELLLRYRANPNIPYLGFASNGAGADITETGTTPLMNAVGVSLSKVKRLVEAGADINARTVSGRTAAIQALVNENLDTAHYLIVERGANVAHEYNRQRQGDDSSKQGSLRVVDLLRYFVYPIGSQEHMRKMEIVATFLAQGIDYNQTSVPPRVLTKIKKLYPETWEKYVEQY